MTNKPLTDSYRLVWQPKPPSHSMSFICKPSADGQQTWQPAPPPRMVTMTLDLRPLDRAIEAALRDGDANE